MKRKLIYTVLVLCGMLLLPTTASAHASYYGSVPDNNMQGTASTSYDYDFLTRSKKKKRTSVNTQYVPIGVGATNFSTSPNGRGATTDNFVSSSVNNLVSLNQPESVPLASLPAVGTEPSPLYKLADTGDGSIMRARPPSDGDVGNKIDNSPVGDAWLAFVLLIIAYAFVVTKRRMGRIVISGLNFRK